MGCAAVEFQRQVTSTKHHIQRIEIAKKLVCGVLTEDAVAGMRSDLEELLSLLEMQLEQILISGHLDSLSDKDLAQYAGCLQSYDAKITTILEGATRIGLEGVKPFPGLLSEFRKRQERLRSQIEGILLSLDDSFQELLSKSAEETRTLA